jgi:hypothetical protein
MSHIDRPFTRPLAGVDQALGEGHARPPVELLDQLRERLDRLDPIHPSAPRRPEAAAPGETGDSEVAAESVEVAESGEDAGSPGGQESRDQSRQNRDLKADQPEALPADGYSSADGSPADDSPARGYSSAGGPATDGEFRTVDVVRADKGERYRPWFTADEPATPWFVE